MTSQSAPTRRSARPSRSRSILATTRIQRIVPSFGRTMRYSARIVLALALQYAEQMLDRSLAVLGMDSTDPFLVGFVGGLGRQAVNQEIFRGAAILDAVAEIDFETADAGDALDPRQFRFAFLQGAMRPGRARSAISCRCCRKRSAAAIFGRRRCAAVGSGRACRQPLPVLSHRKRRLLPASFALLAG